MHQVLIRNYNAVMTDKSTCYFLGDMGLCSSDVMTKVIRQLKGVKVLVLGNHDKNYNAMYNIGFDAVVDFLGLTISQERVTASHCPLLGVYREDTTGMRGCTGKEHWHGSNKPSRRRFTVTDEGQFHLQGHIHSPNNGKSIKTLQRQFDVGVDANDYRPVSISQIESWIVKTKILRDDWRDVVGFDGYKVNALGEVKSFRRYSEGILKKPYKDKDGYLCQSLRLGDGSKAQKVHQIVAKAFLENPNNYDQVNHRNGHKLDNSVNNLEWCDHTTNQHHAWDSDLKISKLSVEQVSEIKKLIKEGISNTEIAKNFNVDPSTISNIRVGKIHKRVK